MKVCARAAARNVHKARTPISTNANADRLACAHGSRSAFALVQIWCKSLRRYFGCRTCAHFHVGVSVGVLVGLSLRLAKLFVVLVNNVIVHSYHILQQLLWQRLRRLLGRSLRLCFDWFVCLRRDPRKPSLQEQNRTESNRIEQNQTESNRIEQNRTESNRIEQNRTESNRIEQNRAESKRIKQNQTESNRIEQKRTESNRIEQNQTESNRIEQNQTESSRIEQNRSRHLGLGKRLPYGDTLINTCTAESMVIDIFAQPSKPRSVDSIIFSVTSFFLIL